jgi:hypothetical protein
VLDGHRGVRHLVFFGVRLLEAVAFADVAVALRCAAGFEAAFGAGFGCDLEGRAAGGGLDAGSASRVASSGASVSALATLIELDSVRWQVSQVTMVRTSVPS